MIALNRFLNRLRDKKWLGRIPRKLDVNSFEWMIPFLRSDSSNFHQWFDFLFFSFIYCINFLRLRFLYLILMMTCSRTWLEHMLMTFSDSHPFVCTLNSIVYFCLIQCKMTDGSVLIGRSLLFLMGVCMETRDTSATLIKLDASEGINIFFNCCLCS